MAETKSEAKAGERIAKVMARAGVCSRREAERLIAQDRVEVNGKPVTTPATLVSPEDEIKLDGERVQKPEGPRLWRFHKPTGLVTSHADEKGRPTVFDQLPDNLPRVISVGRLDLNSEGLLLLTNSGTLSRALEHPSKGWVRRYRARVYGAVTKSGLEALKRGVVVNDVKYGAIDAAIDDQKPGSNTWLTVSLAEGKNREVRKALAHIGLTVTRLIRTAYGPFQLGNLKTGAVEEITGKVLKEQLGKQLTEEIGLS